MTAMMMKMMMVISAMAAAAAAAADVVHCFARGRRRLINVDSVNMAAVMWLSTISQFLEIRTIISISK